MLLGTKKTEKFRQAAIEEMLSWTPKDEIIWKRIGSLSSSSSSSGPPRTAEQLAFLSARRENAKRKLAKRKALEGDLDAITLDMGSKKISLIDSGDTNEEESQAMSMQGVHRSGDATGADPSSEAHASP